MQTHHTTSDQKSPINNNTIDYHPQYPNPLTKNPFYNFGSKFYNPLQVDTLGIKHPSHLFQGLYDSMAKSQRYMDQQQKTYLSPNKANIPGFNASRPPNTTTTYSPENGTRPEMYSPNAKTGIYSPATLNRFIATTPEINKNSMPVRNETKMYSCGICERSDFSTEAEVHTHRKISHNLKTGVSLRCAYCNGDFRSR